MIAECCKKKGLKFCAECEECECALKKQLIAEFNALGIQALPEITELYALKGSFVNLTYDLPNGQQVQLLKDDAICLGNQLPKDGERCYGICTDGNYLIVCEYGENGVDPEIILYKKRGM